MNGMSGLLSRAAGVGVARDDDDIKKGSEELELALQDDDGRVEGTRRVDDDPVCSGSTGTIPSSVCNQSIVSSVAESWFNRLDISLFPRTSSFSSLEKRSGVTSRQSSVLGSPSGPPLLGGSKMSGG